MTTQIKVVHLADFVRARPEGMLDLATGERLLGDIAEAAESLEEFEVLIDTRDSANVLSPADVWMLAATLARHRETFSHKTAILCPEERFDRARFFAIVAANKGFHNFRAFQSYEEAMEWLTRPA
jgi:hypothetical protein